METAETTPNRSTSAQPSSVTRADDAGVPEPHRDTLPQFGKVWQRRLAPTDALLLSQGYITLAEAVMRSSPADSSRFNATERFLASHGITSIDEDKIPADLDGCIAVRVGRPSRDAVLCADLPPMHETSFQSGVSVFPLLILVPEKGRLRIALRVPIAAGPADREPIPPTVEPNYLELLARLDPDGMRLIIEERPGFECAQALSKVCCNNATATVVKRACGSLGTYVWRSNRFVRR